MSRGQELIVRKAFGYASLGDPIPVDLEVELLSQGIDPDEIVELVTLEGYEVDDLLIHYEGE